MTLKLATFADSTPDSIPLTSGQISILQTLEEFGPCKASFFDAIEDQLDDLFKMRPRLVLIVPGHDDAVVTISTAGRVALGQALLS
jgi:hypothetical protein